MVEAKAARNLAQADNAAARDGSHTEPYDGLSMVELRLRVHEAAARARQAGCDISDLVGPTVGAGAFPL